MPSQRIVNLVGYLALLDRVTHRACVDRPLPASGDVLPVAAFGCRAGGFSTLR